MFVHHKGKIWTSKETKLWYHKGNISLLLFICFLIMRTKGSVMSTESKEKTNDLDTTEREIWSRTRQFIKQLEKRNMLTI